MVLFQCRGYLCKRPFSELNQCIVPCCCRIRNELKKTRLNSPENCERMNFVNCHLILLLDYLCILWSLRKILLDLNAFQKLFGFWKYLYLVNFLYTALSSHLLLTQWYYARREHFINTQSSINNATIMYSFRFMVLISAFLPHLAAQVFYLIIIH